MHSDAKLAAKTQRIAEFRRGNALPLVLSLLGAYLLLILASAIWFHGPYAWEGGTNFSYERAMFLSTSAATLTGFQQDSGFNDFKPDSVLGPLILLILTIAGSLFTIIVGGLAGVRVLRLPFSDLKVVLAALIVESLAILLGVTALSMSGVSTLDAFQQAASAFARSGIVITSGGRHYYPPFDSVVAQVAVLPLAVLGGLGLPVLMEFYFRITGEIPRLSTHCRAVISLTAGFYVLATLALYLCVRLHVDSAPPSEFVTDRHQLDTSRRAVFLAAFATAVDPRSIGIPIPAQAAAAGAHRSDDVIFARLKYFSNTAQWLLVPLLVIGANSAGTSGGLKLTTLYLLFIGIRGALRGQSVKREFGIAGVWLAAYLLMAGIIFLWLSVLKGAGMPTQEVAFLTFSATGNVALTDGPVATGQPGVIVLTVAMLAGRLAPLAILWWMASTTRDAEALAG